MIFVWDRFCSGKSVHALSDLGLLQGGGQSWGRTAVSC